ncbi:hypothetical protein AAMO2058_001244400 [Amorphochlora amoebiformis]
MSLPLPLRKRYMDPTPTPDRQLWIQKPANKKARWTQIKPIGAAGGNTPPPPVSFVNQHRSPNGKEGYQIFAQMVAKPSQEYNKSVRVGFQGGVGQTPARQDQDSRWSPIKPNQGWTPARSHNPTHLDARRGLRYNLQQDSSIVSPSTTVELDESSAQEISKFHQPFDDVDKGSDRAPLWESLARDHPMLGAGSHQQPVTPHQHQVASHQQPVAPLPQQLAGSRGGVMRGRMGGHTTSSSSGPIGMPVKRMIQTYKRSVECCVCPKWGLIKEWKGKNTRKQSLTFQQMRTVVSTGNQNFAGVSNGNQNFAGMIGHGSLRDGHHSTVHTDDQYHRNIPGRRRER